MSDEPSGTWIRRGECDGCGFCCEALAKVALSFPNLLDDPEFLQVRGIAADGTKVMHIIDPCPQLLPPMDETDLEATRESTAGLRVGSRPCAIYADRPRTCRDFPSEPELVVGIPCTHWFEQINAAGVPTGQVIGGLRSPYPST